MGIWLSLHFKIISHLELLVSVLVFPKRRRDEKDHWATYQNSCFSTGWTDFWLCPLGVGVEHPSTLMCSSRGGEKISDCQMRLALTF